MSRRAAVLAALAVAAAGCGSTKAEEQLLRNFFQASRARDNTMLAKVATVRFDLVTEGTVRDFEVTGVGAEHTDRSLITKPVTVTARVLTPGGKTVPTRLEFDFQLALHKEPRSGREGSWKITAMRRLDR